MNQERASVLSLSRPVAWRWVTQASFHWGMIGAALSVAQAFPHWYIYLAVIPFMAAHMHGIQVLGHDGVHWHASANRKLNDALTKYVAFLPFGINLEAYRKWHLAHHAHLGTAKDPEIQTIKKWLGFKYELPVSKPRLLLRSVVGALGFDLSEIVVAMYVYGPRTPKDLAFNLAYLSILLAPLYYFGLLHLALLMLIASLTVLPLLHHLRTLFEHTGSDFTNRYKMNGLTAFFLSPNHILQFHYEHHRWPSVPFFNLPLARAIDSETPVLTLREALNGFAAARPKAEKVEADGARINREGTNVRI